MATEISTRLAWDLLPDERCASNKYWIPHHVFVCATPHCSVFLDVKKDKYLAVAPRDAYVLSQVVDGFPVPDLTAFDYESDAIDETEISATTNELLSAGLLTADSAAGKILSPIQLHTKDTMLAIGYDPEIAQRIRVLDVIRFVLSYISASYSLKHLPFDEVVKRVAVRKQGFSRSQIEVDSMAASELVGVFRRMRPFLFTAHNHCLLHALALINFLARYEIFPTWVLGVQSGPFSAHSWVQHEALVLDGTPEDICFFTPIFTV